MTINVEFVGDMATFDAVYRRAGNQRDNLCGCYWAHLVCCAFDQSTEPDEERAASYAGCVVPDGPTRPEFALPWAGSEPGAQPTWPYRTALPSSTDDNAVGTSPAGVALAIDTLTEGRLVTVALRSPEWTATQVVALVERCAALGPIPLLLIANVATKHLVGTRLQRLAVMISALHGTVTLDAEPDWDVGHFGSLAGLASSPTGDFVIWRDTYKPMGERGYSLQPAERVAFALHRDASGAGGVLAVTTPDHVDAIRAIARGCALDEALWSNGSPEPL